MSNQEKFNGCSISSQPKGPGFISFRFPDNSEALKIAPYGFYVRGKKLDQNESEARAVFDGFTEWMNAIQKVDKND